MRGHEFAGLFIGKGKKVDGGLDSLPTYTEVVFFCWSLASATKRCSFIGREFSD